jgi:hypothetical protein
MRPFTNQEPPPAALRRARCILPDVLTRPDFRAPGLRTYPIVFPGAKVARGNAAVTGSPRRNDRIIVSPGS